jgi:hypothetical protein
VGPFRFRAWLTFLGVVAGVFCCSAFVALATYDDDNVPSFDGQDALFWVVAISFAILVASLAGWAVYGLWRLVHRGRSARLALLGCAGLVLLVGGGVHLWREQRSHRELPAAEQRQLAARWARLRAACDQPHKPTAAQALTGYEDLHQLVFRFQEAPDAKLVFGTSSQPRPTRELIRTLTDPTVIRPGLRCLAVSSGAQAALEREAKGEPFSPPGPAFP